MYSTRELVNLYKLLFYSSHFSKDRNLYIFPMSYETFLVNFHLYYCLFDFLVGKEKVVSDALRN